MNGIEAPGDAARSSPRSAHGSLAAILPLSACVLVLLTKLWLVLRINVNWDEFYYLSNVYAYIRGDVVSLLQLIYVHLFTWLPLVGADEMDRILVARCVMWGCIVVAALVIARLAGKWVSPAAAWFAPLAYLAASPVLRHGASFRADSMLAPLGLLTLLLLLGEKPGMRRLAAAGALFGLSLAISIKSTLFAPMLLVLLACWQLEPAKSWSAYGRPALSRIAIFGAASLAAFAALLFLHWLTLPDGSLTSIQSDAVGAARKTLLDAPLFPRWDYLKPTLRADWLTWSMLLAGLAIALWRARLAAAFALSLLPLLFYRNAFPYYYVVMLAPAAVLAAVAVDALYDFVRRSPAFPVWLPVAVTLPLLFQAGSNVLRLGYYEQGNQTRTIAAVHEIFPEPVPYVDHSGMIASFPKVSPFLSSWGIQNYRDRGVGFMHDAIATYHAPMVLANSSVLMPDAPGFELLLDEDRELLERFYVPYWGAIRIAGAAVDLGASESVSVELPFAGRYRVETDGEVIVNGAVRSNGALLEVPDGPGYPLVTVARANADPIAVRLIWAGAGPPPPGPRLPSFAPLYAEL